MPVTKSGIETPTVPPKESLEVRTTVYPGSSKIGHDRGEKDLIEGPGDCYKEK